MRAVWGFGLELGSVFSVWRVRVPVGVEDLRPLV